MPTYETSLKSSSNGTHGMPSQLEPVKPGDDSQTYGGGAQGAAISNHTTFPTRSISLPQRSASASSSHKPRPDDRSISPPTATGGARWPSLTSTRTRESWHSTVTSTRAPSG